MVSFLFVHCIWGFPSLPKQWLFVFLVLWNRMRKRPPISGMMSSLNSNSFKSVPNVFSLILQYYYLCLLPIYLLDLSFPIRIGKRCLKSRLQVLMQYIERKEFIFFSNCGKICFEIFRWPLTSWFLPLHVIRPLICLYQVKNGWVTQGERNISFMKFCWHLDDLKRNMIPQVVLKSFVAST